jgi:hypothetical protein
VPDEKGNGGGEETSEEEYIRERQMRSGQTDRNDKKKHEARPEKDWYSQRNAERRSRTKRNAHITTPPSSRRERRTSVSPSSHSEFAPGKMTLL